MLHYIQQKKGLGFQSPECIIKPEKPIYLRKYKFFEKSLKKWLTKGDGSSIISKLSHDSGQPKGWKGCFHLKGC